MSTLQATRLESILEIATDLFKSKGYMGTSMRDLAEVVGIEAASLYSHVDSKDELLQNICFRMAEKFMQSIDQALQTPNCSQTELLEMIIRDHVRIITEDLNATAVFWNEWKYLSEPALTELSQLQVDYEYKLKALLEAGVAAGEFRIKDTTFTTMAMLSSLNGLQKWRTYSMEPEDLGQAFAELFISGIKA